MSGVSTDQGMNEPLSVPFSVLGACDDQVGKTQRSISLLNIRQHYLLTRTESFHFF